MSLPTPSTKNRSLQVAATVLILLGSLMSGCGTDEKKSSTTPATPENPAPATDDTVINGRA